MLSDNIKNYRKKSNMSQDELAEKLGVSRQSISLWETGQTQPTIENIIALANIFNISSDMLLRSSDGINDSQDTAPVNKAPKKKRKTGLILTVIISLAVVIVAVILIVILSGNDKKTSDSDNPASDSVVQSENPSITDESKETASENVNSNSNNSGADSKPNADSETNTDSETSVDNKTSVDSEISVESETSAPEYEQLDLFSYCKNFAINIGSLNGDYSIYQQPASYYGGYDNEYFSISYWADSDMVEFCLHCPLSDTYSINFYLRMRGGYNGKYEYLSSKYFRDTGESLRSATGYIDPSVFSDSYPISCDSYEGSFDGQNEFMEESRVGMCDLIRCLKEFIKVENMECDFSDFDFVNF